ncbi:E3 ubiquitin-protein ligase RNF25 [Anastrepha obliqua]|uniref:E3 ubiquitin-protein ligase RNF25 n=1 Tax=Anastrepha obliqua TaxID=95512 RepID=UPI002409588E|nr:E3 ubiquitin-protein ligase RNF25 [Anastrepha obliqua]
MDALKDEVESLEAILMDDVQITRASESDIPEVIETTVFPQVGDEAEQYVCVTLQVIPTADYPETSPQFKLLRPRGLDDARLEEIKRACNEKLRESLGFPVVFDLIEVVREHLTDSNLPSGQCVICLYGFSDGDEFTRTECFHYLHSYCLGRHLNALRRTYKEEYDKLPSWLQKTADPFQALCPVCREPIKDEEDSLRCAMPPSELENAPEFKLTRELRDLQQRMSALFLKQKSRGGIIDVDAETGTVISIESEEEMRLRLQTKPNSNGSNRAENTHTQSNSVSSEGRGSSRCQNAGTSLFSEHKDPTCSKSLGSPNCAPVVQPTHQVSGDSTNNNYHHHNRRHFRGGRRHQQHHHHHRSERERERDRGRGNEPAGNSGGSSSGTNTNTSSSTGGKQTKAQVPNSVHGR